MPASAGSATVNSIARWNGAVWIAMGGASLVRALAVRSNGELIAAGTFSTGLALAGAPMPRCRARSRAARE